MVLRFFGADVHRTAGIRGSARIWYPANLRMGAYSTLGPGVKCYNVDVVDVGAHAIVSQNAFLCTASHDVRSPGFLLRTKPIRLEAQSWVCAESFVGPGVVVGEGAVLGARAAAFTDLEPWKIYRGNPATFIRERAQPGSASK